jgi:hypothetical protein
MARRNRPLNIICGDPSNPGGIGRRENGDPCSNRVMHGTTRCALHGGKSPTAQYKAQQMMALLRIPAIEVQYTALDALNLTIEQLLEDTCAACGYPKGDIEDKEALIKACVGATKSVQLILDRTGLGPRSTLEVRQSDGDLDLKAMTPDERSRMVALLAQLRALKGEIRQRIMHGIANPMQAPQPEQVQ